MAVEVAEKMFHTSVISPEALVLEADVREVELPAFDGMIGILTHRAPLLAKLGTGRLTMAMADGTERRFFVEGGYAQMRDNVLTILTDEAIPAERITPALRDAEVAELEALKADDLASMKRRMALQARISAMNGMLETHAEGTR